MFRRFFASIVIFLLIAGSAGAADSFPFTGTWKITGSVKAPWADPKHPLITDDEKIYGGKIVKIEEGTINGPDFFGCGKTEMKIEPMPFAGLFEGGLAVDSEDATIPPDEAKAARLAKQLGFTSQPVPTLFHGCSEIQLHRKDANTLVFGLNDRVFELKKQ